MASPARRGGPDFRHYRGKLLPSARSLMARKRTFFRIPRIAIKVLSPVLKPFCLCDYVFPEQAVHDSDAIKNLRTLAPAQRVVFASPKEDPFVPLGKYFRDGAFDRPSIFVCDIPEARFHVGSGMVCTRDLKIVADLAYRVPAFQTYGRRKPRTFERLAGSYSTVNYCLAWNYYHWMLDCLPRIHSLAKADPRSKLTILMPDSLGPVHRESLECILPDHFTVKYFPGNHWLQLEQFVWPSLISGRCNAYLPAEYYDAIRQPVFDRFGLSGQHRKSRRLYISRRRAKCRRIVNEKALCELLGRFGFDTVEVETLSFRQQVELLHSAEIVVSPHGAGLHLIMFAGNIRVVVLHPNRVPQNQFHTLAKGLGQEYFYLLHDQGEEDCFLVDLKRLEELLTGQLHLTPPT